MEFLMYIRGYTVRTQAAQLPDGKYRLSVPSDYDYLGWFQVEWDREPS